MMTTPQSIPLLNAQFDPKLKIYTYLQGILLLLVTFVGIPLIPFWLVFAHLYIRKHFESLECELHPRRLVLRKGVFFKSEKTILLEQIQDVSLRHGPLLNALGLSAITIETAGQSGQGMGDARLVGVIGSRTFRDEILAQRDNLQERPSPSAPVSSDDVDSTQTTQKAMLDCLLRIEKKLDEGLSR